MNIILQTDSYKTSHYLQYPPRTEVIYSFFESRGGEFPEVMFFGLQYIIKKHLAGVVVTKEGIDEAQAIIDAHMGPGLFNREGWEYILTEYGGKLPVRIRAVKEGGIYSARQTLITVENLDPKLFWLTNYLETLICQVWYPCTVASQSFAMRQDLLAALRKSGTPEDVDFKLHDFGYRGSTSEESSAIGDASHLVSFKGTDTISGLLMAMQYYSASMPGFSIPAAEHSTITSWGQDRETDAYRNMLRQFPTGLVAVVSDSYDVINACRNIWGQSLKTEVCSREGKLIVRPDSGHPPTIVVKVLDTLGSEFGYTVNKKGYKMLDPHVGVIQGDGINREMMNLIIDAVHLAGWSMDNLAFGSGGGLLQNVNRDTCRFAFKCSAIRIGNEWHDVKKNPITDPGKASRAGRFDDEGLRVVFEHGELVNETTFDEVRANRAAAEQAR